MPGIQSASTAAERTARLKAILDGTTKSRDLRHSQPTNLLFGVALHAAAKSEQGGQLTDLEQRLLDSLQRLLPADEIAAAGRAFTQAQTRAGGLPLFPQRAAALPVTGSYGRAELLADLPALGAEVLKQPNCSVVNVADLKAGQPFDTPEFIEAMSEYGGGLTVILGSGERGMSSAVMDVRVKLDEFKCIQRTGDSFLGPSDEIYWMASAGSDTGAKTKYASGEYGNIDNGSHRYFPANTYWFRGPAKKVAMFHMECWEKDRGSFWDEIRNALDDVGDYCIEAAADAAATNDKGAALAALIGLVGKLLASLLDWLLGKDDLIQKREFGWDANDLDYIADNGMWLEFNGEGARYRLKISATVGKRRLYSTTLGSNGRWAATTRMPFDGEEPWLVQAYADARTPTLYCALLSDDQKLTLGAYGGPADSGSWGASTTDDPSGLKYRRASFSAITARNFYGHGVHLLAPHPDNHSSLEMIEVVVNPGEYEWTKRMAMSLNSPATHRPAFLLDQSTNRLHCVYVSAGGVGSEFPNGQVIYLVGVHWADYVERVVPLDAMSSAAPAIAMFDGHLHCVFRGHEGDSSLRWTKKTLSGDWEADRQVASHKLTGAPSLAVANGKLHCVYRGLDNKIWHISLDRSGGSWSAGSAIPGAVTDDTPTIAEHEGSLFCVYSVPAPTA